MGIPGIPAAVIRGRAGEVAELRRAPWAATGFFLLLGTVLGSWVARVPAVRNRFRLDGA